MQPDPVLDLDLRGVCIHVVDELTPAAEGTHSSLAGRPQPRLQHWPGLLGPWEGRTAQCLFLIDPRERRNRTTPQIHFLHATFPCRNTSIPHHIPPAPIPGHCPAGSCRELLPALLLCQFRGICAAVELALHSTETRSGQGVALILEALRSFDFFPSLRPHLTTSMQTLALASHHHCICQHNPAHKALPESWQTLGQSQAEIKKHCPVMETNLPQP